MPSPDHRIMLLSGDWFDVKAPDPSVITLKNIAWGLRKLRWGAHRHTPHTVAAHAVMCAVLAERRDLGPRIALLALHHDDAEFALGDMPTPLKALWRGYRKLERRVQAACLRALSIGRPSVDEALAVRFIDRCVAASEDAQLRPGCEPLPALAGVQPDPDCIVQTLTLTEAACAYIATHTRLTQAVAETRVQ